MCSAPKMPKPDPAAVAAANKKPQYMRNPWLDSIAIQGSGVNEGRNDLVIEPGTRAPDPNAKPIAPPNAKPDPFFNLGLGGTAPGAGGGGLGRDTNMNRLPHIGLVAR